MNSVTTIPKEKSGLNETDKKLVRIAVYTVGTAVIVGGFVIAGKKIYYNHKAKKAGRQTLTDNTPENYAKRLQMAFENDGWWGTNVEQVRQVFTEIPNKKVFIDVTKSYKDITKGNELYADLASELTSSEYYEIQNILSAKPDRAGQKAIFDMKAAIAISHRIKAAFDYKVLGLPGTDKGALKVALDEIPSLYGFALVKVAYKKLYGTEIENDLDSELGIMDFSWKDIVYTKPKK